MMKYESKHKPLLPRAEFLKRMLQHFLYVCIFLGLALFIGMAGYHWICGLGWTDALLNASMILTGMGPVDPMKTSAAKIFASFYALFSGIAFLTMVGVMLAPAIHRFLHKFHLGEDEKN